MRRSGRKRSNGQSPLSSSGSDSQHDQAMNIINKMSKKLLGSKDLKVDSKSKSKKVNSKTSSTPLTRVTRSQNKSNHRDAEYEGDIDTSSDNTSQSDSTAKHRDHYDFDQEDEDRLCLVLFPDETKKSKKKSSASTKSKSTKENKPSQKCSPSNSSKTKNTNPSKTKNIKVLNPQLGKSEKLGVKRKQPDSSSVSKPTKKVVTPEISLMDSGVFMSPIEHVRNSSLITPDVTPIPTPSLSISTCSIDNNQLAEPVPRLEYDSLLDPPLDMSPVKDSTRIHAFSPPRSQRSEPMDTGSPVISPIVEKTYAHRGQFMSPIERKEKQKQKPRSKPRITSKRVDVWASKVNAEFAEIEMYDLSIEDQ